MLLSKQKPIFTMIVEKQTVLKTEWFCEINIVLAISLRLNHVRWHQSCSWLVAFVKGVTAIEVLQKDKKVYNAEEIQEILGLGGAKHIPFWTRRIGIKSRSGSLKLESFSGFPNNLLMTG